MTDLRERFQPRFAATANDRIRRALAALHADPAVVYNELHGLAGEAGIMGFVEISTAAAAGLEVARSWRTAKPTSDQQLQCARILRSLMGLVGELQKGVSTARVEAAPATARRALVVDDSELIAEELAESLREVGFESTTAATMDAAIASVRAATPSVVLLDINIPGVELGTLCASLRDLAPGAKMVVVSAASDDELREVARAIGADGHVGKLRGTSEVVAYIQTLVGGS